MKMIYVASPYAGDVEQDKKFAAKACRHAIEQGHAFFAPHLLYPSLLDDNQPTERQLGLDMGLEMLSRCDELWCYGPTISTGMAIEIEAALLLGTPVRHVLEQDGRFEFGDAIFKSHGPEPLLFTPHM